MAPSTIRGYFQILRDTLLGDVLSSWKGGGHRREVSIGKFYFFDSGLARKLQGRSLLTPNTPEYGEAFEAFIYHELRCYLEYREREGSLNFWRTHDGREVDFIINEEVAVEVKASSTISSGDLKGLKAIREKYSLRSLIVVSHEKARRTVDGIEIMPWKEFLDKLWNGEITH